MAGYPIRGTYEGGAYIDLYFVGNNQAFDVINVWDYETNKSTIPLTKKAVEREMLEWRDAAGDSLEHDLKEHHFAVTGK
jgi:hypothetical protein